ncbi:retrovirus-related pol polyprotein from transposon TNT 1-94 [Tanacetum coccineum]
MNMVRLMLKSKNMPKEFWAEAVQCAIYIQNRYPQVKLMDMTLQECWSGVKPTVSHFNVFGSVAYAHVPDQTRTKLDDKSKKYIFIGYDDKSKAFRLYDSVEKKVTPRNNTHESIPKNAISPTPNEQTVVTTDSENEDELVQQQTRSLQDLYESTTKMHLVCLVADIENITFEEAIRSEKWKEAMDEEINAIERNKTWEMDQLPKGQKPIGVKCV